MVESESENKETETDAFYLGNAQNENAADEFALGSENDIAENKNLSKNTASTKFEWAMPIEDFYEIFVEPYITNSDDYEKSFESEIKIFDALGLEKFVKFKEIDQKKLDEIIEYYKTKAKDKWRNKEEFERVDLYFRILKNIIFKNEKSYRDKLRVPLWKKQRDMLYSKIDAYGTDQRISTEEYATLLKQSHELGLDNFDDAYRGSEEKSPQELINEYIASKDFVHIIADKEFIEFANFEFKNDEKKKIDTKKNREFFLEKYGKLKLYEGAAASEEEMLSLMEKNGLAFVSKLDFFAANYKKDFSAELKPEVFYELKGLAKREFEFSETDWKNFCKKNKIKTPEQAKLNFYIGKARAESIEEIPELMDANKDDVNINTIVGQLNGISRNDLAQKIEVAQKDYADDEDSIFEKTKYVLNSALPPEGFDSCDYFEIAKKLERKHEKYQKKLIGKKNSSLQLWLEAHEDFTEIELVKNEIFAEDEPKEKRLNKIILALEKNNFCIGDAQFSTPQEIVDSADAAAKKEIAESLTNPNSKIYCWIEKKFGGLLANVKKWSENGRHNEVTLSYALEEKSPFHYSTPSPAEQNVQKIYTIEELENYILKNIRSEKFLKNLIEEDFLFELNFWLEKYQNTNVLASFVPIFDSMAGDVLYKNTFDNFASFLEDAYFSKNMLLEYFEKLIPILQKAPQNKIIEDADYESYKNALQEFIDKNENRNEKTYGAIKIFLEKQISKKARGGENGGEDSAGENADTEKLDGELFYDLLKYFFNAKTERKYYENNIHPILKKAAALKLVPETILDEEKEFFVEKYISELKKSDYRTQLELFDSIEKLDRQNPVLLHYYESCVYAQDEIKKENFYKTCSNFAKRNFVGFLTILVFTVAAFAGVLRFALPFVVSIEKLNDILLETKTFIRPIAFLIATQKGNFILCAVIMFLSVKPLTALLYAMKKNIATLAMTNDEREGAAVVDFVISQIDRKAKTPFCRASRYNGVSLAARILFAVLGIFCAMILFSFCFFDRYLFVVLGICALMLLFQSIEFFKKSKEEEE